MWIQQRVGDGSVELCKVKGEENPADLVTKHLTSRDRIRSLLDLFGCRCRDGRVAAAPVLRSGVGTSKGELLKLAEGSTGTMSWQGRVLPKFQVTEGDADTPDALPAEEGSLPHLHEDWGDRALRAVACKELEDKDLEEDEGLEAKGKAIGIALGTSCGERK